MTNEFLKATHEGTLNLGNSELDVAVLSNGQRIITQTGVFRALDRPARGNTRVIGIPTFIDAQNLQEFINEEVKQVIAKVDYIGINGKNQQGYDANILPIVCDIYLKAREQGKIVSQNQLETAQKAEILVRSLAKIAITALIDEATGYQYDREKDELQKILKKYITSELLAWQKTFPDTYYTEIFRLNGWEYTVQNIRKRPGVVGTWTNKVIYEQLPKGVLEELKKKTPKSNTGNYTARFFQSLTSDTGHPHLSAQLNQVIALMRISDNWQEFIANFNKMINRKNGQLELNLKDFEEKEEPKEVVLSSFNKNLKQAINYNPKDKLND
jgi:hypothetical protein